MSRDGHMTKHTSYHLGRDVSPLRNAIKTKLYTSQDINRMLKTLVEPKIHNLRQELETQRQTIIILNERLSENEKRLHFQKKTIESMVKKARENPDQQMQLIEALNQQMNNKLQTAWQQIVSKLRQISEKTFDKFSPQRYEEELEKQLDSLRTTVIDMVQSTKKKSNAYWLKIKQALTKMNTKLTDSQSKINGISTYLQTQKNSKANYGEASFELRNGRRVVKNLVQLKKSVANIYENYQSILSLQKGFCKQIECRQTENFLSSIVGKTNGSFQAEEIVALEYSKEQNYEDIHFDQSDPSNFKQGWDTKAIWPKNSLSELTPNSKTEAIVRNETSNKLSLLGFYKSPPSSPMLTKYSVQHSSIFSINNSQSAQLCSTVNQNNTILINESLERRKEMSQDIRTRLEQLISLKGLAKPLEVVVDEQINYLKSVEGNYLFDFKGNMFKIDKEEIAKLEKQGLVKRGRIRRSNSTKVTPMIYKS